MTKVANLDISIDRGGTFTDCYATYDELPGGSTAQDIPVPLIPQRRSILIKLLSQDPQNYEDAPREGIRRILQRVTGKDYPRDQPVDTSGIRSLRMGTTVATNALLERRGERCVLVITKGFRDLLVIGNQARPKIFQLDIKRPGVLYEAVVEVDERVTLEGHTSGSATGVVDTLADNSPDCVQGLSGEQVRILQPLNLTEVRQRLQGLYQYGYRSIAVCLAHSYTFPDHEKQVGQLAQELGFTQITLSHALMPMIKMVPRGQSACADAYLTPCIQRYIQGFVKGFDEHLLKRVSVQFMQSDGGLVPVENFSGFRAILSGPAAGVVGCALTSYHPDEDIPVVGFDMGGTSTDVSRFDGTYQHSYETTTAGITIQAPQLDIHTVAAGGGSRLFFRNGMFVVGPESAGAHPGPACYRKGGPLTVTDANLVLGRLVRQYFPRIFGPKEDLPLDLETSQALFSEMTDQINGFRCTQDFSNAPLTVDQVAYGFIKVANETMSRPIRALTEARGYDSSHHILSCFGGAGGQHACAIARSLGIKKVLIHQYSSILSAYGLSLADVVHEVQRPCSLTLTRQGDIPSSLRQSVADLTAQCRSELQRQRFSEENIQLEILLNLRYQGTDSAIMTAVDKWETCEANRVIHSFESNYQREFGFSFPERTIIVDDIRIRGVGRQSIGHDDPTPYKELQRLPRQHLASNFLTNGTQEPRMNKIDRMVSVYFETGRVDTPVFLLSRLNPGDTILGPAVIADATFTAVVEPGWQVVVTSQHLVMTVTTEELPVPTLETLQVTQPTETAKTDQDHSTESHANLVDPKANIEAIPCDPIQLAVFSHRFMSIAEQMGRTLQKTAISTNIKERLDFSCAIFDPMGGLVANAPHIPVHLGSIGHAVQYQIAYWGDDIHDGDVFITNHPDAGGSHLPDITVITPVFDADKVVFFVASRGHHADIGGLLPGSMPPTSCELYQEGAAIRAMKIVEGGVFQRDAIVKQLVEEPAKHPGCSGTRCLKDNLSDLQAQIAANQRGMTLLQRLAQSYGLGMVHAYMRYIQTNAELSIRQLLRATWERFGGAPLQAVDYLDTGARIQLTVTIDPDTQSAVFDFTGTSPQCYSNLNAPPSVTHSAVIYCLRCMVDSDIPLNQGCLNPIQIIIPQGSLLNPSPTAAVVGGNVQTSQRVVDVVFKAFEACAASQGDMNNLTFGIGKDMLNELDSSESWGYYETIAGGSGAGPTWAGTGGVHTHMTNTRITDPEIMERRYPVILRQFALRSNSGGEGLHPGGDGVIREIEFLKPIQVSILSERRVLQPYGLQGGEPGMRGENIWLRRKIASSDQDSNTARSYALAHPATLNARQKDYSVLSLGGKNTCTMGKGDRLLVCTPGGGGWGLSSASNKDSSLY
ncbi:hypothetical protein IWQ62_003003 [Dispira parvispora]|uniref:5-oxoprolinase n=1 Tax=Dispira parvispora TaxID=1520584 RepID=A0A9W8E6Y0_9FUNG|nr:hypothetical protein IWQ62_003003 [Dispira parvispora]